MKGTVELIEEFKGDLSTAGQGKASCPFGRDGNGVFLGLCQPVAEVAVDEGFEQVDVLAEVVLQLAPEFRVHRGAHLLGNVLSFDGLMHFVDALCEADAEGPADDLEKIIHRFGWVEEPVEEF